MPFWLHGEAGNGRSPRQSSLASFLDTKGNGIDQRYRVAKA